MVVVAMVGILSAVAVGGVGRYMNGARVADAKAAVSAVKIAQEVYKAQHGVYADLSPNRDADWYPGDPLAGNVRYSWAQPDHDLYTRADDIGWIDLDVNLGEMIGGGCTTQAGGAGQPATTATDTIAGYELGYTPNTDWYVVVCATDFDEDANLARFGGSSLFSEVIVENPTEY
jgi:type II secretory pathway pseudopilin PulG